MGASVILRHEMEGGTWHWDWLVSREAGAIADEDARVLMAFRVDGRPDDGACEEFGAVRLAEHRARYLTYEGAIGRGLGRVERVAVGDGEILEEGHDAVVVRVRFGGVERVWRGERNGEVWRFRVCAGW